MKKVLLSALFALCLAVSAYAQPRAIGGRIGMGVEVSYQHSMGEKNMVEVELGMPWSLGVQASATYDWIFNIKSWNSAGQCGQVAEADKHPRKDVSGMLFLFMAYPAP